MIRKMIAAVVGSGLGVAGYYIIVIAIIFFMSDFDRSFPMVAHLVSMVIAGGIGGYFYDAKSSNFDSEQALHTWAVGLLSAFAVTILNFMILRSPEATPTGPAPIDAKAITEFVLNFPAGALGAILGAAYCSVRHGK